MAKAERITETNIVVTGFNLLLNRDEVQVLVDVLARLGGDEDTTRRKLTEGLYLSLKGLGFNWGARDMDGSIDFNSEVF